MTLSESLARELELEVVSTRKMLGRVPSGKLVWKPHEKSRPLGEIALHIANIPALFIASTTMPELDRTLFKTPAATSTDDIVKIFDSNISESLTALKSLSDAALMEAWTYRYGERVIFTLPRIAVIRGMGLNHLIHHRGQLSVYLRLLDVPLPPVYGPTADEM